METTLQTVMKVASTVNTSYQRSMTISMAMVQHEHHSAGVYVSTTCPEMRHMVGLQLEYAPDAAEIVGLVVVQVVAEARHPHVRGDEDANGVVHLARIEIVV